MQMYTLAQTNAFIDAVARREKAEYIKAITAARLAQYNQKAFKKAMQEITRDGQ